MNKQVKLLLVDDDPDDRFLFMEAVARHSKEILVFEANDGLMAINYLEACPELPDVVLLDINMPVLSGIECLKLIRSNSRFADLPVVMLSTSTQAADIERSFQAGANLYYTKPAYFAQLQNVLSQLLSIDWRAPLNVKQLDTSFLFVPK